MKWPFSMKLGQFVDLDAGDFSDGKIKRICDPPALRA
jgi:hypothetical protein